MRTVTHNRDQARGCIHELFLEVLRASVHHTSVRRSLRQAQQEKLNKLIKKKKGTLTVDDWCAGRPREG